MAKLFISYSRSSRKVAEIISTHLEELGHGVWFDNSLAGGQVWWDEILQQIRLCDGLVIIVDELSVVSPACIKECEYAHSLGKNILPLLTSSKVSLQLLPALLSKIQFVDYRTPNADAAIKLAKAVQTLGSPVPLPHPLPSPPSAPTSALSGFNDRLDNPAPIGAEQQTSIVSGLRAALAQPSTVQEALFLLRKMKTRPELKTDIINEIENLVRKADPGILGRLLAENAAAKTIMWNVWSRIASGTMVGALLALLIIFIKIEIDTDSDPYAYGPRDPGTYISIYFAFRYFFEHIALAGVLGGAVGAISPFTRRAIAIIAVFAALDAVMYPIIYPGWVFDVSGALYRGAPWGALAGACCVRAMEFLRFRRRSAV